MAAEGRFFLLRGIIGILNMTLLKFLYADFFSKKERKL